MKICIACGMPMHEVSDYACNDTNKDYCKYCQRADGTMKSYDEKLIGLTSFVVDTQGLDQDVAREAAKMMMSKLPAWKDM